MTGVCSGAKGLQASSSLLEPPPNECSRGWWFRNRNCAKPKAVAGVRLEREEGKHNVGFSLRPFVLCGLPVRKPPAGEMLYERGNGDVVLKITKHPNYRLPFGQDRIVRFTWPRLRCASRAKRVASARLRRCWKRSECTRRQGVPAIGRRLRANLRSNNLFRDGHAPRYSQGGRKVAIQFLP